MFKITEKRWGIAQKAEVDYWAKLVNTQDEPFFERSETYYKYFKEHFSMYEYDIVIEFGCGPVGLLPHIEGKLKIGLDPLALKYQEMGYNYKSRDYFVINSKGEDIPIMSCCADLVICVNVLDHSCAPSELLTEIYRVAKEKCKIILNCDLRDRENQTDTYHPILISAEDIIRFFKSKKCKIKFQEVLPPRYIMDGVAPITGTLNLVVIKLK